MSKIFERAVIAMNNTREEIKRVRESKDDTASNRSAVMVRLEKQLKNQMGAIDSRLYKNSGQRLKYVRRPKIVK